MENEGERPSTSGRDLVGLVLAGRYRIDQAVSEELLGRVYVGKDIVDKRKVLVKVLHPHLANDDARFGRFLREVRATSMVRHANTIALIDSGTQDGIHFLVMEYFPYRTLEDEMAKGLMGADRVAHIAAQIASAIGAAHQESVHHRALSPRNVLLLENVRHGDFIKVRDFGLSKLEKFENADEASHLTEAGVRVGNTAYMAPEYIERDRFHPKGDLYALGCLMFAMLTGRPPYVGRAADVLTAHVTARVPKPSALNEQVPEWMDAVVTSLLAKEPEDRPGAYQVVQRLEDGVGHRLDPPDPNAPAPRAAPAAEAEPQAVPYVVLGGVALMMGLLAASASALIVVGVFLLMTWNVSAELPPQAVVEVAPVAPPDPAPVAPPGAEPPVPDEPVEPEPVAAAPRPEPSRPAPPEPEVVEAPAPTGQAGRTMIRVASNRRVLVYLNGTPKGYAPIDLPIPPGQHRVAAMTPGQPESRQEQRVQVRKGEDPTVTFTF